MGKSKVTAGIIALFGGWIGLHKFYLKDPGAGMFYIFLYVISINILGFPLSALLGIVDAFKLFTMSDEKFDAKFNRGRKQQRGRVASSPVSRGGQRRESSNEVIQRRKRSQTEQLNAKKRANPFVKSGDEKYKEYDFEGAAEDYKKALEITPESHTLHYNLAATYSLLEQKEKSFHHIEKAFQMGFKDKDRIMKKDAFAYLRVQNDFDAFVANGFRVARQKSVKPPVDDLLQDDVLLSQLNKLKDLRSRGLLSEKEFIYEKEKLLRK